MWCGLRTEIAINALHYTSNGIVLQFPQVPISASLMGLNSRFNPSSKAFFPTVNVIRNHPSSFGMYTLPGAIITPFSAQMSVILIHISESGNVILSCL